MLAGKGPPELPRRPGDGRNPTALKDLRRNHFRIVAPSTEPWGNAGLVADYYARPSDHLPSYPGDKTRAGVETTASQKHYGCISFLGHLPRHLFPPWHHAFR